MKKITFAHRFAFLFALATQLGGCATNYIGVTDKPRAPVQRAAFDELQSMSTLAIKPLDFSEVKFLSGGKTISEDEAFVGKDADKRASWDADKKAMAEGFAKNIGPSAGSIALVPMTGDEAPEGAEFALETTVMVVDPGFFASLIIQAASTAVVRLRVVRISDGEPIFEWIQAGAAADAFASGTRMRAIADALGVDAFTMIRMFQKAELSSGT